jgi:exosortase
VDVTHEGGWRTKIIWIGFSFVVLAVYFSPLWKLFQFAYHDDTFSYIPIIPIVTGYLLFQRRDEIVGRRPGESFKAGIALIGVGGLLFLAGRFLGDRLAPTGSMFFVGISFAVVAAGGFGLYAGDRALRRMVFPFFFLLFMAPFPPAILDPIMKFLQWWSTEAADILFRVSGIPVFRDNYVFSLPGITIEVAKQCSGIRSSLSLFLLSLLSGHLYLRTGWAKAVLTIAVLPITIIKNAVRIFTLTALAVYVDPRILGSVAHQRGGIPIFLLALVLFGSVLWALKKLERGGKSFNVSRQP